MPLHPSLFDICLRIGCAFLAALVIGFNRGERNQAVGLRTTLLVCLAAAIAGVLANVILPTTGKSQQDFGQIDVLRLPLGILSGIGFIGAGAIIKRDDIALGVTTAATMWFISVVGICLGLGFIPLGLAAAALGFLVLWGLKWLDKRLSRLMRATLIVEADHSALPEEKLSAEIRSLGYHPVSWGTEHRDGGVYRVEAVLEWWGHEREAGETPRVIQALAKDGIHLCAWKPAGLGD